MNNLQKLRDMTKPYTVLYVEDNEVLLKRVEKFLENFFKETFLAKNGVEGLESYKTNNPDIVITDLNMPEMDGYTMIAKIKEENVNAIIIVLSAYSNSDNLLKSIHLGVNDFMPKPLNATSFETVMNNVIHQMPTKHQDIDGNDIKEKLTKNLKNSDNIFEKIKILHETKTEVEFINHYKGIPIVNKGMISYVDNPNIEIHVPFFQSSIIKYEKKTIISSEFLKEDIVANYVKINTALKSIILTDLSWSDSIVTNNTTLSIEPNDNLKIEMFTIGQSTKKQKIDFKIEYIAINSISILALKETCNLNESDQVDINLTLEIFNSQKVKELKALNFKGEVFQIENFKDDDKFFDIMIVFELEQNILQYLEDYILKRKQELITEFKFDVVV